MVVDKVESCGILFLPEWPYNPQGTEMWVCTRLGPPQWLMAPFLTISNVCELPRLPGQAATWVGFKALIRGGDDGHWKPLALTKRVSRHQLQPTGAVQECGPVLPDALMFFPTEDGNSGICVKSPDFLMYATNSTFPEVLQADTYLQVGPSERSTQLLPE